LNFDDAAEVTAAAGLDGVDVPVRPGGEILPEHAAEELPRYANALRRRGRRLHLLTTAILSPSSPHTEAILRTAKTLDVEFYRLGPKLEKPGAQAQQLAETRAELKALAKLNRELGVCAIFQNHSPSSRSNYIGGDLAVMHELVKDFDPAQIGVAFDIGHALVVHGARWREHFDRLKTHVRVAYVKDVVTPDRQWVALGEGGVGGSRFFTELRRMNYRAPISLHVEYPWAKPEEKTRARLIATLKENGATLRSWLAAA
jgi:L-ribulose-5-phosphate 3-epimerase